MRYFIADTETTGLKKAKAVEIAFMEIDPMTLDILSTTSSLIDPEIPIEPGAQAIHGITAEMVAEEPTIEEFVEVIMGGRIQEPCVLIAHNVRFDKPFFEPVMNVQETFCSLSLCRHMYPSETENHRLGTMKEFLKLEGGPAHRALGDIMTVHQMLQVMLPLTGKTLLDHLQTPARTIYTMPWGEHKGKALADVPRDYRAYLLSLGDLEEDLRRSLKNLWVAGM